MARLMSHDPELVRVGKLSPVHLSCLARGAKGQVPHKNVSMQLLIEADMSVGLVAIYHTTSVLLVDWIMEQEPSYAQEGKGCAMEARPESGGLDSDSLVGDRVKAKEVKIDRNVKTQEWKARGGWAGSFCPGEHAPSIPGHDQTQG